MQNAPPMSGLLPIATEELLLQPVDLYDPQLNASHPSDQYQENQPTLHRVFDSTQLRHVLRFPQSHEDHPATEQSDQADLYMSEKHNVLVLLTVMAHQLPSHQKALSSRHPLQSSP